MVFLPEIVTIFVQHLKLLKTGIVIGLQKNVYY